MYTNLSDEYILRNEGFWTRIHLHSDLRKHCKINIQKDSTNLYFQLHLSTTMPFLDAFIEQFFFDGPMGEVIVC